MEKSSARVKKETKEKKVSKEGVKVDKVLMTIGQVERKVASSLSDSSS